MVLHCPELKIQLKNIKTHFSAYCLELEQAKNTKEYENIFNIREQIKKVIDQFKLDAFYSNPEILSQVLKERLKLTHIDNFAEGVFRVHDQSGWYFIDSHGKDIIKKRYIYVDKFHQGRAGVEDESGCFFIEHDGKEITKARFDDFSAFSEGRARVHDQSGWFFIDLGGKEITKARFNQARSFSGGEARVSDEFDVYSIDLDGNRIDIYR